jgi:hypothetical protein
MTVFAHTGPNETLNSLRNKYAKKAYAFTHEGQLVRSALACIGKFAFTSVSQIYIEASRNFNLYLFHKKMRKPQALIQKVLF